MNNHFEENLKKVNMKRKYKIILEKVLSSPPRWYVGLYSANNGKQLLHSEPNGYAKRSTANKIVKMLIEGYPSAIVSYKEITPKKHGKK